MIRGQLANDIDAVFRNLLTCIEADRKVPQQRLKMLLQTTILSHQDAKSMRKTVDQEEDHDLEPISLPIMAHQDIIPLLKKIEALDIGGLDIPRAAVDELFLQQKKTQEDKITNRRLQLQRDETCEIYMPLDWSLSCLKYHLSRRDMETLMPNNDLNDNIVNLFLSLLLEHMLGSELKAKSHFFNTYFMSYLIGSRQLNNECYMFKLLRTVPVNFHFKITKNYHSVKKWAKQDIFTKDFVVIPVNMPRHWSLIIVLRLPGLIDPKYGKPQIIYLDSMGEKNKSIIEAVRIYLRSELIEKGFHKNQQIEINQRTLPDFQLLVPRQTNLHDCGLYILTYAERFLLTPSQRQKDFSIPSNRLQLNLFPRSLIFTMRYHMTRMLLKIAERKEINQALEEYLYERERLVKDAIADDFDDIHENQYRKYMAVCKKKARNAHQDIDSKIIFYLNGEVNFYEKKDK